MGEGIGLLAKTLEENGYARYKVKKQNKTWVEDIKEEDETKPKFAIYAGDETAEEREIIRNIFNNKYESLPDSIKKKVVKRGSNINGNNIKIIMLSPAGAEGISLFNVRQVHLLEPYWHNVRIEQVIGRAIRYKSHESLPIQKRNVEVFLYLSTFSEGQIDATIKNKDKSMTTDELIYEISLKKAKVINSLLDNVKKASVDCVLNSKEKKDC